MNEQDKQRLFRNIKVSLYDLEKIVGMVRDRKSSYFRMGDKEETAYLQDLEDRLKDSIPKEQTSTESVHIRKVDTSEKRYRIRYGKNFTAPHWFTGFIKFRTIIESVNYSQSNFWKAKNFKTAENMLSQIQEYHADCARLNGDTDRSDQYWIEEYEETK